MLEVGRGGMIGVGKGGGRGEACLTLTSDSVQPVYHTSLINTYQLKNY